MSYWILGDWFKKVAPPAEGRRSYWWIVILEFRCENDSWQAYSLIGWERRLRAVANFTATTNLIGWDHHWDRNQFRNPTEIKKVSDVYVTTTRPDQKKDQSWQIYSNHVCPDLFWVGSINFIPSIVLVKEFEYHFTGVLSCSEVDCRSTVVSCSEGGCHSTSVVDSQILSFYSIFLSICLWIVRAGPSLHVIDTCMSSWFRDLNSQWSNYVWLARVRVCLSTMVITWYHQIGTKLNYRSRSMSVPPPSPYSID